MKKLITICLLMITSSSMAQIYRDTAHYSRETRFQDFVSDQYNYSCSYLFPVWEKVIYTPRVDILTGFRLGTDGTRYVLIMEYIDYDAYSADCGYFTGPIKFFLSNGEIITFADRQIRGKGMMDGDLVFSSVYYFTLDEIRSLVLNNIVRIGYHWKQNPRVDPGNESIYYSYETNLKVAEAIFSLHFFHGGPNY